MATRKSEIRHPACKCTTSTPWVTKLRRWRTRDGVWVTTPVSVCAKCQAIAAIPHTSVLDLLAKGAIKNAK